MKKFKHQTKVGLSLVASVLAVFLVLPDLLAGSAQWTSSASAFWNDANNWTPATVPNGSSDTATFDVADVGTLIISSNTEVNSIIFTSTASQYHINATPDLSDVILTISGTGITNNSSGFPQEFVAGTSSNGTRGAFIFQNSATAGTNTSFITAGGRSSNATGGLIRFNNLSTASSATITNNSPIFNSQNAVGGETFFADSSSAASATITNVGATYIGALFGGLTEFSSTSTAANATITNNPGTATPGGAFGGETDFSGNSTAANAQIINNGAAVSGAHGGVTTFTGSSTAANATITNNGGTVAGALGGTTSVGNAGSATIINNGGTTAGAGGGMTFVGNAGTATLIANGGTNGGDGGSIRFGGGPTGNSRIEVFGNGNLDISLSNLQGVTVGSIEGDGKVFLGSNPLTVGSSNLSTVFSGSIQDVGGQFSGTGGSITKIGTGTLTLSGVNTYTGGTSVSAGVLNLSNSLALQKSTVTSGGTGIVFDSSVATHAFTFGGLTGSTNLTLQDNAATPNAVALTVGNNNQSGTYSGTLMASGSLTKIGSGTLTLSGTNTYTGGTTISGGSLLVTSTSGSGTGTGSVHVNAGTLGGTGTIAGAVTVGTSSGAGAIISPGTSPGTLTIQSSLTLNSDATYKFELNSSTILADKIVANNVTISGATFSFTDLGSAHSGLDTTFVIIDNTSNSAISGFFSNLADNSTFTNKGNTYLVSYEGGTGNDLTITVVPEPSVWQLLCIATVFVFVGAKIPLLSRCSR